MSRHPLVQSAFDLPGMRKSFDAFLGRRPARPDSIGSLMSREQIPRLLDDLKLLGSGVEVGVQSGVFSEAILEYWTGRRLISIDPWAEAAAADYVDIANVDTASHETLYGDTLRRLRRFGERSEVWRMTGSEASILIGPDSLDFAYLDARHDLRSVQQDISDWWPTIRPGGILAGHDYLDGRLPAGEFGVKSAVDAFADSVGLQVFTTKEPRWKSWLLRKPTTLGQ